MGLRAFTDLVVHEVIIDLKRYGERSTINQRHLHGLFITTTIRTNDIIDDADVQITCQQF